MAARVEEETAQAAMANLQFVRRSLIVLLAGVAAFVCFNDTANAFAWKLWGASGDFHSMWYKKVYDSAGGDPFTITFVYSMIMTQVVWWGGGSWYAALDFYCPAWAQQYKIQEDRVGKPVDSAKYFQMLRRVAFNMVFMNGWMSYAAYKIHEARGPAGWGLELPSFTTVVRDFIVYLIVEEIGFYYAHRLFHQPFFYKRIHKIHHEWTAPVCYAATYAHPIEHVVANMAPVMAGPILCHSHVTQLWLWVTIAMINTMSSHSGYHFPFALSSPEMHDYHHLKFNYNFGMLGVLDWLHGTDSKFRESVQSERDIILLTFTSVNTIFPDRKKLKKSPKATPKTAKAE